MAIIIFRDVPITRVKFNEIEIAIEERFLGFREVNVGFHVVSVAGTDGKPFIIDLVIDSASRATILKVGGDGLVVDRSEEGKRLAKIAMNGSFDRELTDVSRVSERAMRLWSSLTSALHQSLYETQQLTPVKECRSGFEHFWFSSNAAQRDSLITLQTVMVRAAVNREPAAIECLYKLLQMHCSASLEDILLDPHYWPTFADWIAALSEWRPELLIAWHGSYDSIRHLALTLQALGIQENSATLRSAAQRLDEVCNKWAAIGPKSASAGITAKDNVPALSARSN